MSSSTNELNQGSLQRLRQQRDNFEAEQRDAGRIAGAAWAQSDADYGDLATISKAAFGDEPTSHGIADEIGGDPEPIFGTDGSELTSQFLVGWLDGVRDVFEAI